MKSVNLGYNWNHGGDEEIKSNPGRLWDGG